MGCEGTQAKEAVGADCGSPSRAEKAGVTGEVALEFQPLGQAVAGRARARETETPAYRHIWGDR